MVTVRLAAKSVRTAIENSRRKAAVKGVNAAVRVFAVHNFGFDVSRSDRACHS
jgi:hypothetical protein